MFPNQDKTLTLAFTFIYWEQFKYIWQVTKLNSNRISRRPLNLQAVLRELYTAVEEKVESYSKTNRGEILFN